MCAASKLDFVLHADHAARQAGEHAWDLLSAREGAAVIDAAEGVNNFGACGWDDNVLATIAADAADSIVILLGDRLAAGPFTVAAEALAFNFSTNALWELAEQAANGTAAGFNDPHLFNWCVTQVSLLWLSSSCCLCCLDLWDNL